MPGRARARSVTVHLLTPVPMTSDDFWRALLDPSAPIPAGWPAGAWGVLLLFLVPVGGGIPAGVLMARDRGLGPLATAWLYLVSDVILAFVFEPFLRFVVLVGRSVPVLGRVARRVREAMRRSGGADTWGTSPLGLVMVSFVEPMTGRSAAAAVGHGFVSGWAIAITGDMLFFAVIMISTLAMNRAIDDERTTALVMVAVVLGLPPLVRHLRRRFGRTPPG